MATRSKPKQRPPGMPCPKCGFFIEMSVQKLLYGDDFKCPACRLVLQMDRAQSRDALAILQKVDTAMQDIQKHKTYDL